MSPKTTHTRCFSPKLYIFLLFLLGRIFISYTQINDVSSFENDLNGWTNTTNDDFNWIRNQGPTISRSFGNPFTGPLSASTGSFYMYIDSFVEQTGDEANLDKKFNFTGEKNAQISFDFHMLGNQGMGTLRLQVSTDGEQSFVDLETISGNQGDNWITRTVDLSNYDNRNITIRFNAIRGSSDASDIAVDNIRVSSDEDSDLEIMGFSFENSLDGWENVRGTDNFDWRNRSGSTPTTNTGPSAASEGSYYMHIEGNFNATNNRIFNGSQAHLQKSFDLTSRKEAQITFDYHMFGRDTGSFRVSVSKDNGPFTVLFRRAVTPNSDTANNFTHNRWFTANIDLNVFSGSNIIIRFEGQTAGGPRTDIAIDNVIFTSIFSEPIDTDGDKILDNFDDDDDNDGILDENESCIIPGAGNAQNDAIVFTEGDFDIFAIGDNTNGLGFQESGFQEAAFERGMELTVFDDSNRNFNLTTTPNSIQNGNIASTTTGTFANGRLSYRTTLPELEQDTLSGGFRNQFYRSLRGGDEFIFLQASNGVNGLTEGDEYALVVDFTTPVYAFSFDIEDFLDVRHIDGTDNVVLRYEVFADSQLIAYFETQALGENETGFVEVFDANDVVRTPPGGVKIGNEIEFTLGFITNGRPISNLTFNHRVISGTPIGDFHFINKFAWATESRSCFANSLDFDEDGIPNDKDLDSDNDGIPDNVEAQTTIDYIAPSYDYDNKGVDRAYGTEGIIPVNTNRSGNADFVELNSDSDRDEDNNIKYDTTEAEFSIDTDNDGKTNGDVGKNGLDNTLAPDDFSDVNGTIDNPRLLKDIDGDVLTVGDVDYRDAHPSGTPLITQILQTPTDRVIEITNVHSKNSILANTIRLSLFTNQRGDLTGIVPNAISSITAPLLPGKSILVTSSGSIYPGIEDPQITNFSNRDDVLLLTHPKSISDSNAYKNRYETTFEIENNTSYVRSDEINLPVTDTISNTNNQWIRFIDENLDPYRDLADGGPERHPHAPLTSEIGLKANPESNTYFGQHRIGPTSRVRNGWSNGSPDRSRNVIISEDFPSDDDINANTITIENGSKLTMNNSLLVVSDQINISGNNDQIRLAGNSQLIQTHTNTSQITGSGNLLIDQNSETTSIFRYNYMSSPVVSESNVYRLQDVLKDGTIPTSEISIPQDINFITGLDGSASSSPISLASHWFYTFAPNDGIISNWIQKFHTNPIPNTDGFTLKGPGISQNYTFVGSPNDGNLITNIGANQFYLLGNPFSSALSVKKFIEDNINSINGTLYFWQHAGEIDDSKGHSYTGYIGGYSTRNIAMGVAADSSSSTGSYDFTIEAEDAEINSGTVINDTGTNVVVLSGSNQSITYNRIGRGIDTLRIRYRSLIPKNLDIQVNGNTVLTLGFPLQPNYSTIEIPLCVEQGNTISLASNSPGAINIDNMRFKDEDGQISCSFSTTGSNFVFSEPEEYVPVAQGFFVGGNSTGGSIVFNNSQREFKQEGSGQSIFLKSKSKSKTKLPVLKIGMEYTAEEDRIAHRQIGISFNKNNSFEYDNGYDSHIFDLNATDMYWKFPNNDAKYVIAGVGKLEEQDLIPLDIIIDKEKTISIQIDEWNIDNKEVFIFDKLTEEFHSLNNKAIFKLSKGNYNNRFFIAFKDNKTLKQLDDILSNNINLYYNSNSREVILSTNDDTITIKKAEMYSLLGKKIQKWNTITNNKLPVKLNVKNLTIIKLYTNKGQISKKFFIK